MYSALFSDKPSPYTDLGAVDVLVLALFRDKPSLYTDLGAVEMYLYLHCFVTSLAYILT